MVASVIDILGRDREITQTYPDGSFTCPFCASAVIFPADRCQNPGCPASTHAMGNPACRVHFQARIEAEQARQAEAERRQRDHAWAMQRIADEQTVREQWIAGQYDEQTRRGTCRRCLKPDAFRRVSRFVKHRSICPSEAPGAREARP